MAINFFQQQQDARRRTVRLLLWFAAAVVVLTVVTALCAVLFAPGLMTATAGSGDAPNRVVRGEIINNGYFWLVVLVVPTVILSASAYKVWQIGGSGVRIALSMGGLLLRHPKNAQERQLLNIVEEMAVASGMRVPPVYVLDKEPSINAFTAGYPADKMVIGVTEGCLKMLDRGELQGVIAHEFSHMKSGDTALNTRMIGVLFGISMISLIGMRLIGFSAWGDSARDIERLRRGDAAGGQAGRTSFGNGTFAVLLFALCLIVIGALGWFFAAMIKAAVCREREYLADAAAVQFTRHPDGIAGALKKIGGLSQRSYLLFSGAVEFEHMLFSFSRNPRYEFATHATHPPLDERIRRLDPQWDGQWTTFTRFELAMMEDEAEKPRYDAVKTAQVLGIVTASSVPAFVSAAAPQQPADVDNLDYAREVIRTLPAEWLSCARHPSLSCCVPLALLLCRDNAVAREQLRRIEQDNHLWAGQSENLMMNRAALKAAHRLPLIEIALPWLRGQMENAAQCAQFKQLLHALIRADRQVSLFEWCVYTIVSGYLDMLFTKPRLLPSSASVAGVALTDEYRRLFSLAARFCNHGHDARAAYQAACMVAGLPDGDDYEEGVRLSDLPEVLRILQSLPPLEKPQLMHALVAVMRHDGRIDPGEREMLRAIGMSLDCPLPPLTEEC